VGWEYQKKAKRFIGRMLAYGRMKRLLVTAVALAFAAGAHAGPPAPGSEVPVKLTLAAKEVHEECTRLEAGESRRYHWKSDAPVDFNIHYHRGNDVFYLVKRDAMRGDGGTFTARSGEDFCWMWTAKDRAAKLEGRIGK
jgi:hypothetical protein